MAEPILNVFDNDQVKNSFSSTVEIEDIYTQLYKPGRDKLILQKKFEKTMFNWMVKGKAASAALKKKIQQHPNARKVKVHGVWDIVVDTTEAPKELTLRRLVACIAYDNAFQTKGPAVLDHQKPEGSPEALGETQKFHTAMSTLIDWNGISEKFEDPNLQLYVREVLPCIFTPGMHFVFRIWLNKDRPVPERNAMATAFQIAAHCSDLCRHTSLVRQARLETKVTIKHSLAMAKKERGTIASLFINVDGRETGNEPKVLFKDMVLVNELKKFVDLNFTCTQPQKHKEAVVAAINLILEEEENLEGVDAMIALIAQANA